MIFLPEKLEISSISLDKIETTLEKMIQANLNNPYYIKLHEIISTPSPIEDSIIVIFQIYL